MLAAACSGMPGSVAGWGLEVLRFMLRSLYRETGIVIRASIPYIRANGGGTPAVQNNHSRSTHVRQSYGFAGDLLRRHSCGALCRQGPPNRCQFFEICG
ncbi:hypothetical protein KM92DES2_11677 [uncultured Desulfovibrio sp.]|uniref:Uncharacterized protein n=1 Tax=uncultured Desulfovibrio sp. TaxID=167968 RepID=A0A212JSY5_9BACT|nr:hypothetical protein KM92DES2_11677 [uncultured Desulfovibrio sp.]